ncbi:hypothetical protein BTN49_1794 [Candidatus Enterovibrio escicola]|uniref:DNA-directed RNA polymerase C-terminal domain-containing protein n=1 Tax=Candidatus Enterovibrio escicola TaxID=1927127 RepID=A0A2A5T350_9GAMM|nr:hypothetical protein BTN49_1794 [Candidatus Enterovibrio escacola]
MSCSGLQILGAVLRCKNTGQYVNLTATNKPADIYGVIAVLVEKELRELVGECSHAQVLKLAKPKDLAPLIQSRAEGSKGI